MEEIELRKTEVDETIDLHSRDFCPICNKAMHNSKEFLSKSMCHNGCYSFRGAGFDYRIFNHRLNAYEENKVRLLIQYYKENDRYLAEILSR